MLFKYGSLLFILLFISVKTFPQQFGGDPPSVKWNQINTAESRIIFPQQLDSAANRVANIISYINRPTANSIGNKQKKIDIVLKNQTTVSNGFVTLAPFHSEFFLTPLQNSFDLGSIPWIETLAIHEFRHVQQFNNFNVGVSRLFHILFGEAGQAFANNVSVPNWFFEGDAVFLETNVTTQGRGRLPYFHNAFRSLWLAERKYSWMKLRNGSYKHFVPNHYHLGYLLVAYGREKYGEEFWKNVTHDAASFKGLFYPFQKGIKKYSGKSYVQFRNDALNYFKEKFDVKRDKFNVKSSKVINEEYPAFVDANTIVLVKSSYNNVHSFIIRKGKKEKKIRVKDVSLDNHFSYSNGKIVYASHQPDKRWGNRNYNDLKIIDINSGKQHTLTRHTKYFAPDISYDGSKIVSVYIDPQGNSVLRILNTVNGNIITSVPNPQNLFYTYPKFYRDKIITAAKNNKGQMSLAMINTWDGNTEHLIPFSDNVIGFPSLSNDTVYFSASAAAEDKLFAYDITGKKLFELITKNAGDGLGKYQPSAIENKLIWTTFTANGYRLQSSDISSVQWKLIAPQSIQQPLSEFQINALTKTNANLLDKVSVTPLPVKKYSKSTGIVNFHSLFPGIDDPEYSVTLIGNNILNTMQTSVAFTYNRAEKWKRIGLGIDYGAMFPILSAGVDYTFERRGRYRGQTVYWNEIEPQAGFRIPLNLSKGRSITFMNIGSNYVYNQSDFKGNYKDTLGTISYSYLSNFFTISNQIQKARQHIYPRYAQNLSLTYKTALTRYEGSQFVANGNLFLPGAFINHNLVLNAAYLQKDTISRLNFSSGFPFSRGYQSENLHKMYKWGANYHLPLLYPDAGFANIAYLLRIRGNLFYDHTHVNDFLSNGSKFRADFRSTGAEIYFDTKWWNAADVTFGIRYSYLLDKDLFGATGKNRWEIILPINLLDQ